MSNVYAELITNTVKSLNSHVGEGLSTSGGTLHIDTLASESDGTVRGGIAELTAKGHAEQVSTTGKNLWGSVSRAANPSADTRTYPSVQLRFIKDSSIVKLISLSWLSVGKKAATFDYDIESCDYLVLVHSGETVNTILATDYSSPRHMQQGNIYTLSVNMLGVDPTTIGGLSIADIQLELGSEATEYEPYTGGAPSPSPDYPQEIQVVRGRNLLDLSAWECDVDSNIIVSGDAMTVAATSYQENKNGYILPSHDKSMILSFMYKTVSITNANASVRVSAHDENDVQIGNSGIALSYLGKVGTVVFTIPKRATRISFGNWAYGGTSTILITNIQLTLGSTPQPYVPYGHVGLEVQGKNLLPNNATSQTINGVTFTVNADGSVTANGTASATTIFNLSNVRIEPNTKYVLSGCPSDGNYNTYFLRVTDNITRAIDDFGGSSTFSYANVESVQVSIRIINGTTVNNVVFKPQIELGTEATEYEPYFHTTTPIPLPQRGWVAGLPDGTADSLRLDGAGKCEWTLPTSEYVFDGSEAFRDMAGASGIPNFVGILEENSPIPAVPLVQNILRNDQIWSHYEVRNPYSSSETNSAWLYRNTAASPNCIVRMSYPNGISTAEDFKTWLSTHNVTVLYPLATPITEDMGYIDMPSIPSDAIITIPELDNLNIKYMVGNTTAKDYAEQWYERTKAVEIAPVEDAVADLASVASNLVTHDLFYFGYDEVNGKKMISIFKRGDI